jgi:SPP1 gp7 family putative phage head morphogenesis protein
MAEPQSALRNPQLSVVFRRPFDEQVAFFRGKLGTLVPTATWRDLWRAEHDRGFMVAGAATADLLADLAAAVDKAIADGETLEAFRTRFREIVTRHGWHGWTGEGTKAGEAWRTRIIYQTNLSTSYAAGRYAQLQQGEYPYWMYVHSDSVLRPRPQHVAWDGLVLPADHKFWRTHFPPNGYGCRCRTIGVRSPAQAKRLGGNPDKALPRNWDTVDPRTGTPVGIDAGWDYAPGASVSEVVRASARKFVAWDYRLAKAYLDTVPVAQRDALATAIRTQPETGEAVRRYARRVIEQIEAEVPPYQSMGVLTSDEATRIAKMMNAEAVTTDLYEWILDANAVRHIQAGHGESPREERRGQIAITAQEYARLPYLLMHATRAWTEDKGNTLMMEIVEGERRTLLIWEVRAKRRTVALVSMRIYRQTPRR